MKQGAHARGLVVWETADASRHKSAPAILAVYRRTILDHFGTIFGQF